MAIDLGANCGADAESEQYFEQAIQRLVARKEKTVVMVTHRLSSIRNADQIFFMEKGRVVESGSHQQLMKMGGRYAALVECRDDDLGQ